MTPFVSVSLEEGVDLTARWCGRVHARAADRYDELMPKLAAVKVPPNAQRVRLLAPIDDPQKFLAIGMNYRLMADEAAAAGVRSRKVNCGSTSSQLYYRAYDLSNCPRRVIAWTDEAELGFVIAVGAARQGLRGPRSDCGYWSAMNVTPVTGISARRHYVGKLDSAWPDRPLDQPPTRWRSSMR